LFTRSLNFVFLEMGRQTLQPGEEGKCRNVLEKFIFSMKNMHLLSERPASFDEPILLHLYQAAELASMTVTQRQNYDKVMTNEIDKMCEISFARRKGREEGLEQGKEQMARNLKELGVDIAAIAQSSGLTEEQVWAL
jgi:predicted transposase/invertase (TIGR01784 family)